MEGRYTTGGPGRRSIRKIQVHDHAEGPAGLGVRRPKSRTSIIGYYGKVRMGKTAIEGHYDRGDPVSVRMWDGYIQREIER
jgi:hypothetical protein